MRKARIDCWVSGLPRNGTAENMEAVQGNTRVSTKVQVLIKDAHRELEEEAYLHALDYLVNMEIQPVLVNTATMYFCFFQLPNTAEYSYSPQMSPTFYYCF